MPGLVTTSEIEELLRRLPPEKLQTVYDLVSYLLDREDIFDFDSSPSMPAEERAVRSGSNEMEDEGSEWGSLEEEDQWGPDRPKADAVDDF